MFLDTVLTIHLRLCSIRNWNVGNHVRFKPRINVYSTESGVNFSLDNLNYLFALLENPHKHIPVDKKKHPHTKTNKLRKGSHGRPYKLRYRKQPHKVV